MKDKKIVNNIRKKQKTKNNMKENNFKNLEKTSQIITILTFLSALITATMTASHFIADYIILEKYSIWPKSIINIEMLEITTNIFIAIAVVILLSICFGHGLYIY